MSKTFYHERGTVYFYNVALSDTYLLTIGMVDHLFSMTDMERFRNAVKEREDYLTLRGEQ